MKLFSFLLKHKNVCAFAVASCSPIRGGGNLPTVRGAEEGEGGRGLSDAELEGNNAICYHADAPFAEEVGRRLVVVGRHDDNGSSVLPGLENERERELDSINKGRKN